LDKHSFSCLCQNVIDIDEEQKDRHVLSKRKVIPLPLMRANPETDGHALFPKDTVVMALYPQTTCFYKAIVHRLPQTATEDYEVLFEDSSYMNGYAEPFRKTRSTLTETRWKRRES